MSTPLRLLIIEDSEDDALLLIRELAKNGYDPDCERVDTPEGMQSALAAGAWDVVVSDYVMPRFSGLAALRMLKESDRITDPHIFIRITCENGRSVLYVRDNCGGIPDEVLPKIFDPYFTTRGPDRGTGIGLYMSKVIIEQNMAGHLTACNVDGGAEFRIEV
ncbi:MAG: ATP-binding protein [Desulfuromonadales bacterium]